MLHHNGVKGGKHCQCYCEVTPAECIKGREEACLSQLPQIGGTVNRQCMLYYPFVAQYFSQPKILPKLYISITSMILPIRQCLYVLSNKSSKYYFVFFLFYMGFQLEGRGYFCQFPKTRHNEKYSVNPTRPIFGKLWSYRLVRPSWEQSQ